MHGIAKAFLSICQSFCLFMCLSVKCVLVDFGGVLCGSYEHAIYILNQSQLQMSGQLII